MLCVRKGTTKRCCYGVCKSDTRYKSFKTNRFYFINFPKPCLEYRKKIIKSSSKLHIKACVKCAKCELWVKKCSRSDRGFRSIDDVTKDTYICLLHFLGESGPTEQNPDPLSYQEFQHIDKSINKVLKARTSLSEKYNRVNMEKANGLEYRKIDDILSDAQARSTSEDVRPTSSKTKRTRKRSKLSAHSSESDSGQLHEGHCCNGCHSIISGFRYTCLQCADMDLCASCEAAGMHAAHYVLRVPVRRPTEEIDSVVEKIREELFKIKETVESMEVIIKEEPDPLGRVEGMYIDTAASADSGPATMERKIFSTTLATTYEESASMISNIKQCMELEQPSKIRHKTCPAYVTLASQSDANNVESTELYTAEVKVELEIEDIKVEVDESEPAQCDVFVHRGASAGDDYMGTAADRVSRRPRDDTARDLTAEEGAPRGRQLLQLTAGDCAPPEDSKRPARQWRP